MAVTAGVGVAGVLTGAHLLPQAEPLAGTLATATYPTKVVPLHNASGTKVAQVVFTNQGSAIQVNVVSYAGVNYPGFHGLHVHANDNPANGTGCDPSGTAFASADAHYVGGGDSNRAVVLRQGRDNLNNVRTGTAADRYTPNSAAATAATAATGDAGSRFACGVIPAG